MKTTKTFLIGYGIKQIEVLRLIEVDSAEQAKQWAYEEGAILAQQFKADSFVHGVLANDKAIKLFNNLTEFIS